MEKLAGRSSPRMADCAHNKSALYRPPEALQSEISSKPKILENLGFWVSQLSFQDLALALNTLEPPPLQPLSRKGLDGVLEDWLILAA